MASRYLGEGFVNGAVDGIRRWFARSPEAIKAEIQRGGSPSIERAGLPFNLVSQFGYDTLAEHLRLDQDLQARYTDYEEMDEYGEITCLRGDSTVFTLERGWVRIEELDGKKFHVLAYDKKRRSLVPSPANAWMSAPEGHSKQMVRVTLDNGEQINCTHDHPFLTKDGEWVEASALKTGQRLMPGNTRISVLGGGGEYWEVHQPHPDSEIRNSNGQRWTWVHRLVAEEILGAERGSNEIVHHVDENKLNNAPSNLSIESYSTHAGHHIAKLDNSRFFPEWTEQRRQEMSDRMRGNVYSRGTKRSEEHRRAIGRASSKPKSEAHRRAIGLAQPNRIDVDRRSLEGALKKHGTISGAAKELNVSWSTAKRRANELDLLQDGTNHRVLKVELVDDRPAVYDVNVPGYHNFVCQGVVVHNTALDIYADDSAMPDMETGRSIWVESENKGVERELNDLLHKRLLIEDDIWGLDRTIAKYGNAFGELLVAEQGLVGINYLPPPTMRRVEGPRGQLLGFVQDVRGEFNLSMEDFYKLAEQRKHKRTPPGELTVFEDWEVVHWRLRGKHLRSVYGHGVVDAARWIWKRLALLEDALLIYKLSRAPARYAFYVDIGDYDMERGLAYVNRVKNQFVKKKFVNPNTGKLDMRHNPLAHDEDFFVPSKGGKDSTRIEVLQGPDYAETDTVEYHRDKLVSALKVPKMYMGYGGEEAKSSLSAADIRFARTVMRIQRETRGGARKACRVHLIAKKMDVERYDYDVKMSVPSSIMELAQLEVLSATADLIERTREYIPMSYLMQNYLHMSEQEAEELMNLREEEKVRQAKTEAKVAKLMAAAEGGAQGEGGGFTQVPDQLDQQDQQDQEDNGQGGQDQPPGNQNQDDEEENDGEGDNKDKGKKKPRGKGGKPKKPKSPNTERRQIATGQLLMMERRLTRMLEAQHKRTEQMFEAKLRNHKVDDRKVQQAIESDPKMRTRMRELRSLLGEMGRR